MTIAIQALREFDPICPDVDIALALQITLAPGLVLFSPCSLQAGDRRRRQPLGLQPQKRRERLAGVAYQVTFQVRSAKQFLDRLGLPQIGRNLILLPSALGPRSRSSSFAPAESRGEPNAGQLPRPANTRDGRWTPTPRLGPACAAVPWLRPGSPRSADQTKISIAVRTGQRYLWLKWHILSLWEPGRFEHRNDIPLTSAHHQLSGIPLRSAPRAMNGPQQRTTWCNGYRNRALHTRLGRLNLKVRKLRQGVSGKPRPFRRYSAMA